MGFNAQGIFNKLQQQEQQRAAESTGGFSNTNILKLKKGNTYQLRLLYLPPIKGSDREYPMINAYTHSFWDDNATGNRKKVVACPTSQYLDGDRGFSKCPICDESSKFYKEFKDNGSGTAQALYKKFKRNFDGYIPVYVVAGPEEEVGNVKILRYGKQLFDFLNLKIFGLPPKVRAGETPIEVDADDIIGIDAFTIIDDNGKVVTQAYDLSIAVTSKMVPIEGKNVEMPNYSYDFKRKKSNITAFGDNELTAEYFETLNTELEFDKTFYIKSTLAELEEFKLKYITAGGNVDDAPTASKKPVMPGSKAAKPAATKVAPKADEEVEEVEEDETDVEEDEIDAGPKSEGATATDDDGDIDIDALLNM